MSFPSLTSLCLAGVLGLGCASQPTPQPLASGLNEPLRTPSGEVAPLGVPLADSDWHARVLPRLALSVQLPEAAQWQELRGNRWVRLEHPPSRSILELSTSRERRLVTPEECEQRARLERPELPHPADADAVDRRRLKLPNDTFTNVAASFEDSSGDEVVGHVTFFGASVGRCLFGHFSTRVHGDERYREVARRLRLAVDGILPSIMPLAADDRVHAQPFDR